jgi:hypothetical protein
MGFAPAVREGDIATYVGPPDLIKSGSRTMLIGNKPAARFGDPTEYDGTIILRCPTVRIGNSQGPALMPAGASLIKTVNDPRAQQST